MNKPQRSIIILCPSFSGGGAEKVSVNLANYYASTSLDVFLIVFRSDGPYVDLVDSRVKVICLSSNKILVSAWLLNRAIKRVEPVAVLSVIRGSNVVLGLATLLSRKLNIVYREASTINEVSNMRLIKRFIWLFLIKVSYARANWIIANSLDTKN